MSLRISTRKNNHTKGHSPYIIGVCGLSRNMGTTCFCIALSNYLCSKLRKDTAYLEMNRTGEISYLHQSQNSSGFSGSFYINGICLYPEVLPSVFSQILARGHEYLVIDYGVLDKVIYSEFLRCNRSFILYDPCPWKQTMLKPGCSLLTDLIQHHESQVTFLLHSERYSLAESLKKVTGISPSGKLRSCRLPYLPDPFLITSSTFEVFEKILNGV